jgi:hypothetical protein
MVYPVLATGRQMPVQRSGASVTLLSSDTSPEAERMQIELFRWASLARRFGLARSLSQTTMSLARQAIRRRHPAASDEDVLLLFVEYHYGRDLACRLRADLARRHQP